MINILISITALIVLIKSADIFIDQSTSLAKKIQVSGFFIGFTLVAVGTTLPDLIISTYSTSIGQQQVAIATFLGSAIIKTTLLLGIVALFSNYKLQKEDVKKNIPTNILIYSIFFLLLLVLNFTLPWYGGIISIVILLIAIYFANKNNHKTELKCKTKFNPIFLILSLLLVIVSGKLTVDHVVLFAEQYNIAQTTIGYFILAIGTTTPELITSLTCIKKGNIHLSLGNILGSSLFDILLVSGITSLFGTLDFSTFKIEIVFLIIATAIFFAFALLGKKYYISKKEGVGLILLYIIFILLQGI